MNHHEPPVPRKPKTNQPSLLDPIEAGRQESAIREFVAAWNTILGGTLKKVVKMTPDRRKAILRLIKEDFPTPGDWARHCRRIAAAPHLTGRTEARWFCYFDWVLKPANHVKILEGNYDPKGVPPPNGSAAIPVIPNWNT
jgi:hypothetical protein